MMNIPPSEAAALSMHDYESLLFHWNEAHDSSDGDPPDPEVTMALIDRINSDPRLTGPAPAKQAMN